MINLFLIKMSLFFTMYLYSRVQYTWCGKINSYYTRSELKTTKLRQYKRIITHPNILRQGSTHIMSISKIRLLL